MKVIGITGGVGAGKSTVLRFLEEEYGAVCLQADQAGHLLMEPGARCYQPVIDLFGREVLTKEGRIDRRAVGAAAFSDAGLLTRLNAVIHPQVKAYVLERMEEERAKGTKVFLLEAALLLEEHYDQICDEVWYVWASREVRRERLRRERGYSPEKIRGIFANQLSEEAFLAGCQVKIENDGDWEATCRQIRERMRRLRIRRGQETEDGGLYI